MTLTRRGHLEAIGVDGVMVVDGVKSGGRGLYIYCCINATLGVANHHPEKKSTYPKFFARPNFYPTEPILGKL